MAQDNNYNTEDDVQSNSYNTVDDVKTNAYCVDVTSVNQSTLCKTFIPPTKPTSLAALLNGKKSIVPNTINYTSDLSNKIAKEFFTNMLNTNEVSLDKFIKGFIDYYTTFSGSQLTPSKIIVLKCMVGMFIYGITLKDRNKSISDLKIKPVDFSGFLHKFGKTDSVDLIIDAVNTCQGHFFDEHDCLYKWWHADGIEINVKNVQSKDGLINENQHVFLRYTNDNASIPNLPKISNFAMRYINKRGDRKVKLIFEQGCFYTFDAVNAIYKPILESKCWFNGFANEKCDNKPNIHTYVKNLKVLQEIIFGGEETFITKNEAANAESYQTSYYIDDVNDVNEL